MSDSKGRADFYNEGDWNAQCYACGRKGKASEMVKTWQGFYVHPEHVDIVRHPQDFVRGIPDRQAPPWTQPPPADTFLLTDPLITERSDELIVGDDYILTELGELIYLET